nr:hypothetical protein [Tanacetum cinerariifolium]
QILGKLKLKLRRATIRVSAFPRRGQFVIFRSEAAEEWETAAKTNVNTNKPSSK